ncbi:hypothetical protein [Ancylomarina sp. 16SWW S1-10-2]|uniref:hypothetical protein n=1 Tax=Ancylomarina sp. 16SWW S1-10-2 TaxID=2499681 RepID=UPI0012AE5E1E|nr:hypothetical protein [Ancylomarina sp. 16SWW S1-10-2]MRT94375.1 hypothetical protein [Ancylomarina sp. 16SWW S1-10-2]
MNTKAPNIYIFNATNEIAIANGTVSFMPNKILTRFEQDLDILPICYAEPEDVILVHQIPDEKFIKSLQDVGMNIPHFKLFPQALTDPRFLKIEKAELRPWGWSPRIHHQLAPFKSQCSQKFSEQPNAYWKTEHKELYSRKLALKCLEHIVDNSSSDRYISKDIFPILCTTQSEVEELQQKWQQIVIKSPWSSSGRGLQVLRKAYMNKSIRQVLGGALKSQGYVMVEALLDKKLDFSVQFYSNGKGQLEYLGFGFFKTDSKGQYQANYVGYTPELLNQSLNKKEQELLIDDVKNALKAHNIANEYCGYLGVDCMLIQNEKLQIKIQPCLEINLRYNMGTIAIKLASYIHPKSKGTFNIYADTTSDFVNFNKIMTIEHPFEMKDGKWLKGYLPLTSPNQDKHFGAYIFLE